MKNEYISFTEMTEYTGSSVSYPKHVSSIVNVLNQHTQATRPKNVGQITDMAHTFADTYIERSLEKWKTYYNQQMPGAISKAVEKIANAAAPFNIDRKWINLWVEDLIYNKSYQGLLFQEIILQKIAELEKKSYHRSNKKEEQRGIDGWLNNEPVSVKPNTYKSSADALHENIRVRMIFYKKDKHGLKISY